MRVCLLDLDNLEVKSSFKDYSHIASAGDCLVNYKLDTKIWEGRLRVWKNPKLNDIEI